MSGPRGHQCYPIHSRFFPYTHGCSQCGCYWNCQTHIWEEKQATKGCGHCNYIGYIYAPYTHRCSDCGLYFNGITRCWEQFNKVPCGPTEQKEEEIEMKVMGYPTSGQRDGFTFSFTVKALRDAARTKAAALRTEEAAVAKELDEVRKQAGEEAEKNEDCRNKYEVTLTHVITGDPPTNVASPELREKEALLVTKARELCHKAEELEEWVKVLTPIPDEVERDVSISDLYFFGVIEE